MRKNTFTISLIGLLIFTVSSRADTILLKDGSTVKGSIISKDLDSIKLDTGVGIGISYYMDEIELINGKPADQAPKSAREDLISQRNDSENSEITKPKPISSEFEPIIDNSDEEEFIKQITVFLEEENFEALESIYQQIAGQRIVFPSGEWKISVFYHTLDNAYADKGIQKRLDYIETLKKWGTKFPGSIAQLNALLEGYRSLGWEYRGSGFARTIAEDEMKKFQENLQKSLLVAQDLAALSPEDPYSYQNVMWTGLGTGSPKEFLFQLGMESHTAEPLFFQTFKSFAIILLPRWMGEPGELEAYAQWIADQSQPYGDEIYARIADGIRGYIGTDFFAVHKFSWTRIKKGFDQLTYKYPDSYPLLHSFCWFATYAQDKALAYELFNKIQDHWDKTAQNIWNSREEFLKWKKWAEGGTLEFNAELYAKIKQADLGYVRIFIENGGDINQTDMNGYTPLMVAINQSFPEIALLLLEHNANVSIKGGNGYDALLLAANAGLRKIVESLIEKGVDINSPTETFFTALHLSADNGYSKIVELLLRHPKINVNARTKQNSTALHFASNEGHLETVRVLLDDKRIDINAINNFRETALHMAVRNGHADVVKALIDNGAEIDLLGHNNFTPLAMAREHKHQEIIDILLSHGAKEFSRDEITAMFEQARSYTNKGDEHLKKGEIEKARELFKKAIDNGIGVPQPYYNLYLIVFNQDRNYPEALHLIEKAIMYDPNVAIYYYQRGRVYQQLRQEEEALRSFRKYIELDPNSSDAKQLKKEFPEI